MYIASNTNSRELKDALYIRFNSGLNTSPYVLRCLLQCSEKNKLQIFYSLNGLPIAYMAYALISKQTLYMLSEHNEVCIRDYELDEGRILYIMDLVVAKDHSRLACYTIRNEISKRRLVCGRKNGSFRMYSKVKKKFKRVFLTIKKDESLGNRSSSKLGFLGLVRADRSRFAAFKE